MAKATSFSCLTFGSMTKRLLVKLPGSFLGFQVANRDQSMADRKGFRELCPFWATDFAFVSVKTHNEKQKYHAPINSSNNGNDSSRTVALAAFPSCFICAGARMADIFAAGPSAM